MDEYRVPDDSIAAQATAESEAKWTEARQADENGDRFVLLTVVFASVLFFGGIEQKFGDRRVRLGILTMGAALFLGGVIAMINYPLHIG